MPRMLSKVPQHFETQAVYFCIHKSREREKCTRHNRYPLSCAVIQMNDFEMKWKSKNIISCATLAALQRNTAWAAYERRCLINFYDESLALCIAGWFLTVFHSRVNILATNRNSNILIRKSCQKETQLFKLT